MRSLLRSLLVLALATRAAAAAFPEEEDVVVLDTKNFDAFISTNPLALVEFYAPWCGHCKELAPKWAEAAAKSKKLDTPVPLAKLDADAHGDLAGRFGVSGYPTLKLFRNGVAEDYSGGREADQIVAALQKIASFVPPSQQAFDKLAYETAGQQVAYAWSGSYSAPPVMPLINGKKPPVPGLLLLDSSGAAKFALAVPRKREEFTPEWIAEWLSAHDVDVKYEEAPPPEEPEPGHGGDGEYPYGDD
ncbi:hypothetical protein EMIHUDRAFT_443805 [Emiliania huxleyi CCMP1516]|uniref:Thioredoxin domain-containing protein n=2 Tax=Emiliania huxleyi TaxID=2903 RepID=A0A0D3JMS8_EMIH1|nr:hypothetical protein EMIHUDRAFT_443805 [Emiliania huxleyi CCMP1516]EOD24813.1 hypothetical protein EMIHUDRAFT_443805 [Emiliania huxleyi CCMP1516]|eukprot:XP_005777242.1 hypothetical protein EMIHUDRAFT_443805 [Emiliania huxleyi CCMP1516]